MSDSDSIEEIREQRRQELRERAADTETGDETTDSTPTEPVHVDDGSHLEALVADHDVVLVDFYADWCGPCQTMAPAIEEVATETDGVVAKVDIDAHQDLAAEHGVRGVPTLLLFARGDPVERVVGVRGADELASLIEQY